MRGTPPIHMRHHPRGGGSYRRIKSPCHALLASGTWSSALAAALMMKSFNDSLYLPAASELRLSRTLVAVAVAVAVGARRGRGQ